MGIIKQLLGLAFMFLFINLLLWGVQEIYYYSDNQKIKRLEKELDKEKFQISILKDPNGDLYSEIKELEFKLNRYKRKGLISLYNSKVGYYNFLLTEYKRRLDNYNSIINNYNRKVKELNKLIRTTSTRFYLIPIPIHNKSLRHTF